MLYILFLLTSLFHNYLKRKSEDGNWFQYHDVLYSILLYLEYPLTNITCQVTNQNADSNFFYFASIIYCAYWYPWLCHLHARPALLILDRQLSPYWLLLSSSSPSLALSPEITTSLTIFTLQTDVVYIRTYQTSPQHTWTNQKGCKQLLNDYTRKSWIIIIIQKMRLNVCNRRFVITYTTPIITVNFIPSK